MTGKRRVFVLVLRRDGAGWRGRIKDNAVDEVHVMGRETVVRELEMLALTQVLHGLRNPDAPLVKEIRFEVEEA
jgi:hypothetical protein